MKKLIVSFAFALIALTSYAQSRSGHLTFKGIPIEGSMTEFCQKLKAKGFTSIGSENNVALFVGDFQGAMRLLPLLPLMMAEVCLQ